MPIVRFSELEPPPANVVVIGIVTFVDWALSPPAPGSVALVNELDTSNRTAVSAPGASGPYGLLVASALIPAGSARLTAPVCGASDQLWTSTRTVLVSPAPIVSTASERPSRLASGAVSFCQASNSAHLPQRWKRPSAGGTRRGASAG